MTTSRLAGSLRLVTQRPVVSESIRLQLILANESGESLTVVDPEVGNPSPDLHWTASADAYRIGVLASFGSMQIDVTTASGTVVASKAPAPWVTPLVGERVLRAGESLKVEFDLAELFAIDSPGNYRVVARYGNEETFGSAELVVEIASSDKRGAT